MTDSVGSNATTLCDSLLLTPEIELGSCHLMQSMYVELSQLDILSQLDESYVGVGSLHLNLDNFSPIKSPVYTHAPADINSLTAAASALPTSASMDCAFSHTSLKNLKHIAAYLGIRGNVKKKLSNE